MRTDFQRSGLAHLLAVSGQNVVLLAMLALGIGMVAGLPLRARLALALALVVVYVPLAGGGPSIQRAGVMGGAGLVAALAGRPASRWYALGLAVVLTLALNPRASGEVGWQLSFAAVVGLLALAPRWREGLRRAGVPGPLADAAAVTAAATVATAPLMALYFEQVSLASLPANLAAAPAVAPVMWLGMLGIAAAQVSPALCVPLNAAQRAAARLRRVDRARRRRAARGRAAGAARRPGRARADLRGRRGGDGGGRAGVAMARARRRAGAAASARRRPRSSSSPARSSPRPRSAAPRRRAPGELVISFLDIGQGDATLLQHGGAAILVDTGPPGGPILRRLRESGVERLDALVLTHAEADHEGMGLDVIAAFKPRLILDGGAGWPTRVQRGLPRTAVPAHAGQAFSLGAHPPPAAVAAAGLRRTGARTATPTTARWSRSRASASFDVLLPADAESGVTGPLELPDVDVLKVAHHGSDDPGLPALLARTKPEFAAIEVGRENTYGHPTADTLAALKAAVPTVVRTDRDGTVRLRVSGNSERIERSR